MSITIRTATADDHSALVRVAELDSADLPAGTLIVGEEDGAVRAAMALESGRTIADPFHRSNELVTLLQTRARQLRSDGRRPLRVIARSTASRKPLSGRSALRTT